MEMEHVRKVEHPLIKTYITTLRDVETDCKKFREAMNLVGRMIAYEITKDVEVEEYDLETPLQKHVGHKIKDRIAIVPILRAGMGLVDSFLDYMPQAEVWHVGVYRDEETLNPVKYYCKLPPRCDIDCAYVVDPMLATGGTAKECIRILKEWANGKPIRIRFACCIACPEGIRALTEAHPDVPIVAGEIDEGLNEVGYIFPGLGDAGDRLNNTNASYAKKLEKQK